MKFIKQLLILMCLLLVSNTVIAVTFENALIGVGTADLNNNILIYDGFGQAYDQKLLGGDGIEITGKFIYDIAYGDVDGDGASELAVVYVDDMGDAWHIKWRLYDSDYNLVHTSDDIHILYTRAKIEFGDVDGDGNDELVLARAKDNVDVCVIYDFSSVGAPSSATWGCPFGDNRVVYDLALGDVDGDGADEIGIARQGQDTFEAAIYRLEGGAIIQKWGSNSWSDPANAIAFGDVDGDGRDEVAVSRDHNEGNKFYIFDFTNPAGSTWTSTTMSTADTSGWSADYGPIDMAFGNIDNDPEEELGLVRDFDSGFRWRVYDDDGTTLLLDGGTGWGGASSGTYIEFGDFNFDGVDEIIIGRYVDSSKAYNKIYVYRADGTLARSIGNSWGASRQSTALTFKKPKEPDFLQSLCLDKGYDWTWPEPYNFRAETGGSALSCCGDDSSPTENYDDVLVLCCNGPVWNANPNGYCCDNSQPMTATNCGVPEEECSSCSATTTNSCFCPSGCEVEEGTAIYPDQSCGGSVLTDVCSSCSSTASSACVCGDSCYNAGNIIDAGETCGGAGFAVSFEYNYDTQGNLLLIKPPHGRNVSKIYDTTGRLKSVVSPDTGVINYQYDIVGNLEFVTKQPSTSEERVQIRVYDDLNRLKMYVK